MKKRSAVVVSVVMMVAILATILTYSFAWFNASQKTVDAQNGSFHAMDSATAIITSSNDSMVPRAYGGETGEDLIPGQDDYPFKAVTTFSLTLKPLSGGNVITGRISEVDVKLKNYEVDEETEEVTGLLSSIDEPEILNNFSFDVFLVKLPQGGSYLDAYYPGRFFGKNDDKWYDKEGKVVENTDFVQYFPSECFGMDDNVLRDLNGTPLKLEGDPDVEQTLVFVIEITFLDRDSYCLFKDKAGLDHPKHPEEIPEESGDEIDGDDPIDGEELPSVGETEEEEGEEVEEKKIRPFAYSDYFYMQSIFEIYFDIGMTKQ